MPRIIGATPNHILPLISNSSCCACSNLRVAAGTLIRGTAPPFFDAPSSSGHPSFAVFPPPCHCTLFLVVALLLFLCKPSMFRANPGRDGGISSHIVEKDRLIHERFSGS